MCFKLRRKETSPCMWSPHTDRLAGKVIPFDAGPTAFTALADSLYERELAMRKRLKRFVPALAVVALVVVNFTAYVADELYRPQTHVAAASAQQAEVNGGVPNDGWKRVLFGICPLH